MSTATYTQLPMIPKLVHWVIAGTCTITFRTLKHEGFYILRVDFIDRAIVSLTYRGLLYWPENQATQHELAARSGFGEDLEAYIALIRKLLNVHGSTCGDDFLARRQPLHYHEITLVEAL